MEVYFTPEVQAQQERRTSETGRPADELLQDALAGYFDELTATREMLNSRYDDLKTGRVKPVSSVEVRARLQAKSEAWRADRVLSIPHPLEQVLPHRCNGGVAGVYRCPGAKNEGCVTRLRCGR